MIMNDRSSNITYLPNCDVVPQEERARTSELLTPDRQFDLIEPTARRGKPKVNRSGPVLVEDLKRETGLGLATLRRVEKAFKGDPLRQANAYFENFTIPAATGRVRPAAFKSHLAYRHRLRKCVKDLAALNMRLQNLSEMSRRHVVALTKYWVEKGASVAYMSNLNTVLRRFGIWMGKPDLAPVLSLLVSDPDKVRLRTSATEPKTLAAHGVDEAALIASMDKECRVAGLQLRLMLAFGLRVEETVMFRPFSADRGNELLVEHGTKGGRARLVPLNTDEKRELIDLAKAIAVDNVKRILSARPRLKFHQSRAHFYYLAKKVGLTKAKLGVTLHGLRHEFADRRYKELTGVHAPVNGGPRIDRYRDWAARDILVLELGHSDRAKTAAYLGTSVKMEQHQRCNLDKLVYAVRRDEALQAAIAAAQITGLWINGPAADGDTPKGVVAATWRTATGELSREHAHQIANFLSACVGARCVLVAADSGSCEGMSTFELV
jgi:integrase